MVKVFSFMRNIYKMIFILLLKAIYPFGQSVSPSVATSLIAAIAHLSSAATTLAASTRPSTVDLGASASDYGASRRHSRQAPLSEEEGATAETDETVL